MAGRRLNSWAVRRITQEANRLRQKAGWIANSFCRDSGTPIARARQTGYSIDHTREAGIFGRRVELQSSGEASIAGRSFNRQDVANLKSEFGKEG
ncbi:unnamed protein product [Linum trigynum]|uniref:Uncharacterized protein n=1 Tax=Linum trigynum TaxID=586398 RepID=A0AAV2ETA0_9ROSI